MLKLLCVFVGVMWSVSSWSSAGYDWLSKMSQAFNQLSYDGVFVYNQGNDINSMRIRHGLIGGVRYESLSDLDGERHEMIRVDGTTLCVAPDIHRLTQLPVLERPFSQFRQLDEQQLAQTYSAQLDTQTTWVADREVKRIELIPQDDQRYGHVFWLDQGNGFLLKHDVVDGEGKLLERTQFTTITFTPELSEADFVPAPASAVQVFEEEQQAQDADHGWRFAWLPTGMQPVWQQSQQLSNGVSMMLLSDGIASVSLFALPVGNEEQSDDKLLASGATSVAERMQTWRGQQYLISAVGEIPPQTIDKLLQGAELREAP
ncbi:transcriptional regulator [Maribrevibacterium harenarium]|uniref:Transcriptional regulator n=1 Tax=Maribrevibacterium harenarium TaxID=2589817 RepID=A0A501WSL7_9GAMM|nr:MucB/RseB C-terminal domain-containing protein [Maribrevibacterium harenarium]TPE51842.1 transcriptional regulator [Maribrevibacterium harenarium]